MMTDINESPELLAQIPNQAAGQQQAQHQMTSLGHPQNDASIQSALTIRLLMQGKEVGSIIGKKGDNIKRFREVSGAKITVSDSSCPDRIVTLMGSLDEVYNAFSMICCKFEEQILQANTGSAGLIISSTSPNSASALLSNNDSSSVLDPLFGLPSNNILSSALKDTPLSIKKETEMLTINNNSSTTINNNNINAPNNNNMSANKTSNTGSTYKPLVTLRFIIHASQCGSLIGRAGAKIKEIRELSNAAIQVAPDVLPNSTERVVTISGNVEALRTCAYQIFLVVLESPPKGYNVLYRPKPALNQMLLAAATASQAAAAYNLPGSFGLPGHPDFNRMFVTNNPLAAAFSPASANLKAAAAASGQAAAALNAVASQSMSSQAMVIPNGLIGCVIGKGGQKINEIRQLSGATIKISNSEEGTKNRTVTINGAPDAINLAQYLITASYNGQSLPLLDSIAKSSVANKSARKFTPY